MKMKTLALAAAIIASLALASCGRAMTNFKTLISSNCGESWREIPVGRTIPGQLAPCDLRVDVPNYPMGGESNFIGIFSGNVRVSVNSAYDYTIIEPLKFIEGARFIGRQNTTGETTSANVWDMAENLIIDRAIRDISNSPDFLQGENITNFSPGEFESRVQEAVNARLAERGVQLNSFTFVVTPDDQTRNMIDAVSAVRVCLSSGMTQSTCDEIITNRAGATRVTVNTTAAEQQN